jgi:thiol-disulfide isomerase/thioredoxin
MKKIAILTGLFCLFFACSRNKTTDGTLTASLTNIPDGTLLNFVDIDSGKTFQKIKVFDNKFEITYNFPTPRKIIIREDYPKYPKYQKKIWLENSKISITGNYDYFVNAKVEGSASNIIGEQFDSFVIQHDNQLSELRRSIYLTNDKIQKDSISEEIERFLLEYRDKKIELYLSNTESEVTFFNLVYEITDLNSVLTKSDVLKIYNLLPDKFKSTKKGELLKDYISLPDIPKVGEKFIDCSQQTPDGKTISLSDNLGKYTLIDFWSSWCGPCRAKHPTLRKLYNLYHDKGFNIISISADENINDWKSAIKQDSLTWIQISDLKGIQNKAFLIYGIRAIPQSVFLGENGIIMNYNFDNMDMETEIAKLFKK